MADKQQNDNFKKDLMIGGDDIPYEMTVAGSPEETIWDHMVNAVKPGLTPNFEPKNKPQDRK